MFAKNSKSFCYLTCLLSLFLFLEGPTLAFASSLVASALGKCKCDHSSSKAKHSCSMSHTPKVISSCHQKHQDTSKKCNKKALSLNHRNCACVVKNIPLQKKQQSHKKNIPSISSETLLFFLFACYGHFQLVKNFSNSSLQSKVLSYKNSPFLLSSLSAIFLLL